MVDQPIPNMYQSVCVNLHTRAVDLWTIPNDIAVEVYRHNTCPMFEMHECSHASVIHFLHLQEWNLVRNPKW